MTKLTKAESAILDNAERFKRELWGALDYVESNGRAGSLDDLYTITSVLFSNLTAKFPSLDFSKILDLYEAFKNYRRHKLSKEELRPMADVAVILVNSTVKQIIDKNRIGKEGGDSEQTVNDRMMTIFVKDKRCMEWTQREWADKLGVSAPAIAQTKAWDAVKVERARRKEALKKGGYSALS